jgi:hypothetical protein
MCPYKADAPLRHARSHLLGRCCEAAAAGPRRGVKAPQLGGGGLANVDVSLINGGLAVG